VFVVVADVGVKDMVEKVIYTFVHQVGSEVKMSKREIKTSTYFTE
jgi:hypothetical protein